MRIVDFLRDNWSYISIALVVVLEIVLLICKRLNVKIKLPSNTYTLLIELIKEAESVYGSGHGKEKFNYVLEKYCSKNEIKYFDTEVKYYLSFLIESILEVPTKKGGFGREEVEE